MVENRLRCCVPRILKLSNDKSNEPQRPAEGRPEEPAEFADEPELRLTWLSEGLALSQRVLVVAFSLGVPVLIGAGLDYYWPIWPQFPIGVLFGTAFGMLAAGWQLWRLTQWLAVRNSVRTAAKKSGPLVRRRAVEKEESE